jgi:hypothetical protein
MLGFDRARTAVTDDPDLRMCGRNRNGADEEQKKYKLAANIHPSPL